MQIAGAGDFLPCQTASAPGGWGEAGYGALVNSEPATRKPGRDSRRGALGASVGARGCWALSVGEADTREWASGVDQIKSSRAGDRQYLRGRLSPLGGVAVVPASADDPFSRD